jgi:hypothetical protein
MHRCTVDPYKLSVGGNFQWHADACINAPLIIVGAKRTFSCTVAWAEMITLKQPAVKVGDRGKGKLLANPLIQVHSNFLEFVLELRKLHGTAFCCTHVTMDIAVCSVRLCAAVPDGQTDAALYFGWGWKPDLVLLKLIQGIILPAATLAGTDSIPFCCRQPGAATYIGAEFVIMSVTWFVDACLERVYTSAGPPVGDQASDQP